MSTEITKTAVVSRDGRFRYRLGRRWGAGRTLAFVMLNPSTADADNDDPTIRRCIAFAKLHGFDGIDVVNLYAYPATKPVDLKRAGYIVGAENDTHIREAARTAGAVCVAWGDNAAGLYRPYEVLEILASEEVEPMVLDLTARGIPRHPLMLRADCKLQAYHKRPNV